MERLNPLGQNVEVGAFSYIDPTARIGDGTRIGPQVYIGPHVRIGAECDIQPGVRIGQSGFGYFQQGERWVRRAHNWGVVIADGVHIGANTCIDGGSWRPTLIGKDTRIDNLCHIAHNVEIGENCMIVALAELSGSVVVEDGAWVAPCASVRQRLRIGKGATVALGAVVVEDVDEDSLVVGVPARKRDA